MFSRPCSRLLLAFSITPVATRRLHRIEHLLRGYRAPQTRFFTTPAPQVAQSSLQQSTYDKLAEATMEELLDELQNIIDSHRDSSLEVEYNGGVITLDLGQRGTYVINKQPPNKQIWLSSPISGPKRFNFDLTKRQWVDSRNGEPLEALLNEELSVSLDVECDIDLTSKDS